VSQQKIRIAVITMAINVAIKRIATLLKNYGYWTRWPKPNYPQIPAI